MEYKDYYKTLEVSRDASQDDIRKSYRRLARRYHPDVNPNDGAAEERFKEINEAYEVLRDPDNRRKYDQLGAQWNQYQQMGGDATGFDWSQWFGGGGGAGPRRAYTSENININDLFGDSAFSEFFQTIFGAGASPGSHMGRRMNLNVAGRDIEQPVDITLEEAYRGTARILQIGSRRLEVKIPVGVRTGSRVRVAGGGESGRNGGQPGDLYLVVSVLPHARFDRDGDDLKTKLGVDLYTLVLGGEVAVATIKGRGSLKVPPGTSAGQTFRLRGQGLPNLRNPSSHGDLFVSVEPELPTNLSAEEKRLFEDLAAMRKNHVGDAPSK